MIELFRELFSDVNLPVTVLMIGVLLYWLMVIVGVFGMDMLDFGMDGDVDVGLDADLGDLRSTTRIASVTRFDEAVSDGSLALDGWCR